MVLPTALLPIPFLPISLGNPPINAQSITLTLIFVPIVPRVVLPLLVVKLRGTTLPVEV